MTKISVVIPSFNRPESLQSCLEAIDGQTLPADQYEVVVVDDGSETELEQFITPHRGHYSLKILRQDNSGPASARNRGVASASGEFIAFTDDDCQPHRDWLSALLGILRSNPNSVVGGKTTNHLANNIYSEASQVLIDHLYDYYAQSNQALQFFTTNNLAVSRERFLECGGFDEAFPVASGEDREFCDRWIFAGSPVLFAPEAEVFHSHRLDLAGYCRLHYRYGQGAKRFWAARKSRGQPAMTPERVGFYTSMLTRPWRKGLKRPLSLSSLLMISQVANSLGYFSVKQRG